MPIRDTLKGGWHPGGSGKDAGMGKGVSARRDFKGVNQVAKLVGKGKPEHTSAESAQNHHSAPLSTLKDPDSFGPPPRHVARAEPITPVSRSSTGTTKSYATTGQTAFPESKVLATAPAGGSWGAPLPQSTIEAKEEEVREEEEKPEAPSVPYRANTTGLSTAGLPAPPVMRREPAEDAPQQQPKPAARAVPKPPPRLPPRQNSNPHELSEAPPPPYTAGAPRSPTAAQPVQQQPSTGYLNQGSLNRLGRAGVSVPGLDIRGSSAQPTSQQPVVASPQSEQPGAPSSGQLSELQARFNRMPGRVSSPTTQSTQTTGAAAGTTWQQKQAALQTASKFNKDPSSVSLSDAREAGSTMNNFRQRHGEQVASGMRQAQASDQKHGLSTRLGGMAQGTQQTPSSEEPAVVPSVAPAAISAVKKAPPPPPKKKPALVGGEIAEAPPPVPMASKPRQ